MTIKNLLKFEELGMFMLALAGFLYFEGNLWAFFLALFLPDISMIGYLVNPYIGAIIYNTFHFKGLAVLLFVIGIVLSANVLIFIGLILFAHSSLDRFLGYGLKYRDEFKNTSLGKIGKK